MSSTNVDRLDGLPGSQMNVRRQEAVGAVAQREA